MSNKMDEEPLVPADDVKRIAHQAEETFLKNGSHWDTYFYKIVLSGNVKVIRQVVEYMENNAATKALDWLFKRNDFEEVSGRKSSKRMWLIRTFIFIFLTIVTILLTPAFYALHILTATFCNRKRRRISANIQLPLAFAAFSQEPDMIAYFLGQGVDVAHADHHGNNIFHYVSDLSSACAEKALELFRSAVKEIDDVESVKKLLEHDRNSAGLTAVEYVAKFGSPSLLSEIQAIMHHIPFSASEDHVVFAKNPVDNDCSTTRVELVDVSRYEAGMLTDQSTLLNILSDRDVCSMSLSEVKIFGDNHFMGKWLMLKCKQMMPGVIVFQLCDFIFTCFMVYALSTSFIGEQGVNFKEWRHKEDFRGQIKELKAWTENKSSVFKQHAFDDIVQESEKVYRKICLRHVLNLHPGSVDDLLNVTGLSYEESEYYEELEYFEETKIFWFVHHTNVSIENILKEALTMPQFVNQTDLIRAALLYPQVITQFAKDVTAKESELFFGSETVHNIWGKIEELVLANFTFTDDSGTLLTANLTGLLRRPVYSQLCPDMFSKSVDDFLHTPPAYVANNFNDIVNHVFDACYYQMFINTIFVEKKCKSSDKLALTEKMFDDLSVNTKKKFPLFYIICTYIYIIVDVIERCVFLTTSVTYQTRAWDMMITALSQKVPGSYARKQLNLFSCIAIVISYHVTGYVNVLWGKYLASFTDTDSTEHFEYTITDFFKYWSYMTMLFIVAIVVRFLMHIHSLRLLPGIGHFIITTFMMATNLLHFSAVFGTVLLIFSVLFHILIDDPQCPLEKSEGFVTLLDSMFSTFKLTFAHGDMKPFFSSAPVQLTYVLYVIIVGLLLLNLIIAIMSTTAMEIMAEPWKEVLWKMEWLDEATSVEYTYSILTLPFRKLRSGYTHQKAGYIVKKMAKKKYKVYIECFYCPTLHDNGDD